jgi:hypothetical protein
MIPLVPFHVEPDDRAHIKELVAAANPTQIVLILIAVVEVLDLWLVAAEIAR